MRPRIRSLKPEMWQDERIVALSREARLCLLGLITMADDEGRFRARRSEIWGWVFPDDEEALTLIDGWIAEIRDQSIVVFYVEGNTPYGAFRHWRKHQKINKPTPSDLPPPPDRKVLRDNSVRKTGDGRENSGRSTGESTSSTGSVHHSHAGSDPIPSDPDPVVVELCERLGQRIAANDPRFDMAKTSSPRWLTDMRRLLGDRQGDRAEIELVIDWCAADSFERSNVLSPGKLRDRFTALLLKASKQATVHRIDDEKAARQARRLAAMQSLVHGETA